jgi:hypothetical protein
MPRKKVKTVRIDAEEEVPWTFRKISHSTYVEVKSKRKKGELHRAHFLKEVFSFEDISLLHLSMVASESWLESKNKRGHRQTLFKGRWAAQGHSNPRSDKDHYAGKKYKIKEKRGGSGLGVGGGVASGAEGVHEGESECKTVSKNVVEVENVAEDVGEENLKRKAPRSREEMEERGWKETKEGNWEGPGDQALYPVIKKIGDQASKLVQRWRPDVYEPLRDSGMHISEFGIFTLFMGAAGGSKSHYDSNDFISLLIPVHIPEGCSGGGLDLEDFRISFNWKPGDCVMLDSDSILHGSFLYKGQENPCFLADGDRLIALFVLHRPVLRVRGFPDNEDLHREKHGSQTIPLLSEGRHPVTHAVWKENEKKREESKGNNRKRKKKN